LEGTGRGAGSVISAASALGDGGCVVVDIDSVAASCGEVTNVDDVRCGNSAGGG
jgi:hypothetical protein